MSELQPAVSVVIPVHNCGELLRPCLCSIQEQTFKNIEVIIVDNSSEDGSSETARDFAARDGRFRVINSTKGFAGTCRNIGIDNARGEYIAFVDGDDRLDSQFIEKLYTAARQEDADIAVCGFYYCFLNGKRTERAAPPPQKVFSREDALRCLLRDKDMRFFLWNKIFRRSLFTEHDIRVPDMYYEDAVVTPKLFCFAQRVASLDWCGYYYTRAFSKYTEVSMSLKRANDYVNTVPLIRAFLEEQGLYQKLRNSFMSHYLKVYLAIPYVIKQISEPTVLSSRENLRRARAKLRLCRKSEPEKLRALDLERPVIQ